MRKNYVLKLGALALAVSLITTGMMGTTLARYADEAVGEGTVAIAKWGVELTGAGKKPAAGKFDFTLSETKNENAKVASGVVAPGDTGAIQYEIADNGTDVDYKCEVKIDTSDLDENIKGVIKFYSDDTYQNEFPVAGIPETVLNGDTNRGLKGTIYWRWETSTADGDLKDTAVGKTTFDAAKTKFTVTLSAEQILPTDTPPSP